MLTVGGRGWVCCWCSHYWTFYEVMRTPFGSLGFASVNSSELTTCIHIYIVGCVFIMSVLTAVRCEPLWSFILYSVIKVKATCLWLGTSVTVVCVKVLAFLGMFWYCDQSDCIWSGCGRLCHALLNSVSFYFRVGKRVRQDCKEDTEYQPFAFGVWNPSLILYSIIIKSILTVMPYH